MKNLMRSLIILVSGLLILASCTTRDPSVNQESCEPLNVLFISVDDLNYWIGPMGGYSNSKTPNLDRLAAMGITFSNAYTQSPLCGPSRASILTGLRPSTTGIYGMINDNQIRDGNSATKDVAFLPEYFKQQGYYLMGIGKIFHDHAPDGLFDESGGRVKGFGPAPKERIVWDGYGTSDRKNYGRTNTDWGAFPASDSLMPDHQSVDWVLERLRKEYNQPIFMGLGFLRPHVPLYVPQKYFDLHPLDQIELAPYTSDDLEDLPKVALQINNLPMMPSTEWAIQSGEWPKIIQAYLACVSFVDYELGRVLDALEESPHAENTIIVLWSDHGYRLGEKGTFAKHGLWESATKSPLLFASPGLPKGKVIGSPFELLSIYPTLIELAGLPSYEKNEGQSLVSLMKGDSEAVKPFALTTYGMNNHAIRTERFRYIQYEDGTEELYDHDVDPNEWVNQAENPIYSDFKTVFKDYLPKVNAKWDPNSSYTFQPYFVKQKERINGPDGKPVEIISAPK